MLTRSNIPAALQSLAAMQGGVVSRDQALQHGVTRHVLERLVSTGAWRSVSRGLFQTIPTAPSWEGLAWGGLLLGGDGARLGPEASGHLHDLILRPPTPVDVLIPEHRRLDRAGDVWQFVRERPGVRSRRSVGLLTHLPIEDTVLDLCAATTEEGVVDLVTRAVNRRRTTAKKLLRQLSYRSRHPHRRLLTDILGDVEAGAESALEIRYLHDVERAHGLPAGVRQHGWFTLLYITDVGYEEFSTLVELDGRDGHDGEGRSDDMRRDNRFALRWLTTVRYGWRAVVGRPCEIAYEVGRALTRYGWTGEPTRCSHCLNATDADFAW